MQSILYRKGPLRIVESWFHTPPLGTRADIARCMQLSQPLNFGSCTAFHTLTINLGDREENILASMHKGTRYEIRRAQIKDSVQWRRLSINGIGDIRSFVDDYNTYLPSGSSTRRLNTSKVDKLARARLLDVTVVEDSQGAILTWHVYVLSEGIARLLYSTSPASASPDSDRRNLAGRANRYHHWMDIRSFKDRGLSTLDFGGFYEGGEDLKKLEINKFKQCFGGKRVITWNCLYATSMLGRLALAALNRTPQQ